MATELASTAPRTMNLSRDIERHRTYKVVFLVNSNDKLDGPYEVLNTSGLPLPGSSWSVGNDVDEWAFFTGEAVVGVHQEVEGDVARVWRVELTCTTKPPPSDRCQDQAIEDPLQEPNKVSGGFIKYTEEATHDRFGNRILNSAFEQLRGPQNEWDANRPTVKVEQNVAALGIETFAAMIDHVNDAPLWGFPRRCVKLSNATWERKIYGTCNFYYTRVFEFEIKYDTFDRNLLDEGTKVIRGDWERDTGSPNYGKWVPDDTADYTNPNDFIRFKDINGENSRCILNGRGEPYDPDDTTDSSKWWVVLVNGDEDYQTFQGTYASADAFAGEGGEVYGPFDTEEDALAAIADDDLGEELDADPASQPGTRHVEKYDEANFLLLGIPTTF